VKAAFAVVDSLRTRYFIAGKGPPLLLVHPVGYPAEIYARTIAGVSDSFTVVAADLPGQGFTEPPTTWDRPPQVVMADHVLALADHLGFPHFSVLGSSLGGLVAALIALRAPDRIDHLVLVGTGTVFNPPGAQSQVLRAVYANGSRVHADPSLATCRERMRTTCHVMPDAEDILLAHISAYALPGAAESYKAIIDGLIASLGDPDATVFDRLQQIITRTLVVVGAKDIRTSYAAHRDGAARMPDARIVAMPECGHLPFVEVPDAFNALLKGFLAGEAIGERPEGEN
jgi:pimeloyl-ACP methyl ester carboxylesterase